MADNRYNVDDILREVKEKRAREERAAQTGKRPPATPEDLLRQLDAAGAGLSGAKPAPQKPKREEPKREQPTPAELLQRAEPPARSPSRNSSGRSRSSRSPSCSRRNGCRLNRKRPPPPPKAAPQPRQRRRCGRPPLPASGPKR